jgi:hypothetical protein
MEYIKRVTPPDRLHFFNVKDGWAPLCKILDLPIPDEPFPHVDDDEQIQKDIQELILRGVVGWLWVFGLLAGMVALGIYALKQDARRGEKFPWSKTEL